MKAKGKAMPLVSGFVRAMGEGFGYRLIGEVIRQGMAGEPVFWASEGGAVIGTRLPAIQAEASPVLPLVRVSPVRGSTKAVKS